MTSRYCYCPMTSRRLAMKITLADRIKRHIRRLMIRREVPDVYPICGYNSPVFPGK